MQDFMIMTPILAIRLTLMQFPITNPNKSITTDYTTYIRLVFSQT